MTGTGLARREAAPLRDVLDIGKALFASGMFGIKKPEEAITKILAGQEFGLGPVAAMNGIHMVDGKPTLAANLIAGQIKRHPHYDYRIIRREADGCELEFFELDPVTKQMVSRGVMKWEKKDATAAGLLGKMNWKKYPRDMFFARCLTAGARTYCPDVLGGSPVYTAEELGAEEAVAVPNVAEDAAADHAEALALAAKHDDDREPSAGEAHDEAALQSAEVVDAEPTIGQDGAKALLADAQAAGLDKDGLRALMESQKLGFVKGQDLTEKQANELRAAFPFPENPEPLNAGGKS